MSDRFSPRAIKRYAESCAGESPELAASINDALVDPQNLFPAQHANADGGLAAS